MNYTTNYHLPQWDETDRIMRTDFNQMCADMEKGLTDSAGGVRSGLDCFHKLAYNHYCMVRDLDPVPYQTGVFYKDVVKDPSDVSGTMVWQGARFAGKTDVELTTEIIVGCYQELTQMQLTKGYLAGAEPMTASFTPPASGAVGRYSLVGSYYNKTSNDTTLKLELTLTNQDTGSVEQRFTIDFPIGQENAGFAWLCGTQIRFVGGVDYLISIRPLEDLCDMTLSLSMGDSIATVSNEGIASATYDIHEPEGGTGGMAILRCLVTGAGGELSFSWDGVEMEPACVRLAHLGDERFAYDYIFLREDPVPVDSTLSMRFECSMGGNFLFYGWGAMLF